MLCSNNLRKMITYSDFSFFINLAFSLKCYSSTEKQPQSGTIGKVRVERSLIVASALSITAWIAYINGLLYVAGHFEPQNSYPGQKVELELPELQECTTGMCGANACDTCTSIYTSLGKGYSCDNLANGSEEGITRTQDGCTVVSDEVNQKIVGNAVKKLESQKKQSPEMADQIDQEIEQIKNSKIKKICSCSSDGCNDPQ